MSTAAFAARHLDARRSDDDGSRYWPRRLLLLVAHVAADGRAGGTAGSAAHHSASLPAGRLTDSGARCPTDGATHDRAGAALRRCTTERAADCCAGDSAVLPANLLPDGRAAGATYGATNGALHHGICRKRRAGEGERGQNNDAFEIFHESSLVPLDYFRRRLNLREECHTAGSGSLDRHGPEVLTRLIAQA